jgi:ATP-dependent DNA helicase RecG
MEKPRPMNRLLNGDVGSGKTVVAAMASLSAINSGFQVALMAPTEVLARQHFESICKLFKDNKINIALLTNSYREINNFKFQTLNFESSLNLKNSNLKIDSKIKQNKSSQLSREDLLLKIKNGEINLIIGTHALIQKDIKFKNLALVIVDEQHRFGVQQRAYLQQEAINIDDGIKGKIPHFLTMTATPIPRTLALAFFGNLNLSVLDEMPKNRKRITTKIVGASERNSTYEFVRNEIKNGRQAFIIFPLVEESQKLSELKAATEEHERLSKNVFPDLKLALLHGRLKSNEKEKVMQDFKNKKYDILVSTSVVEVGIDVPNATIMIIEDADRFGLSQLHQFRGRVGRNDLQSYCFLFAKSSTLSKSRLRAMEKFSSGFDIADQDLKLRGPGEFLGTRQSGIPDVAMQHISNVKLIEIAHEYAEKTLKESPDLKKFPLLEKEISKFQKNVHLE